MPSVLLSIINTDNNFSEIELSAGNEEESVSGHSVVVYADKERNSSEIGKIHLSLNRNSFIIC